MPQAELLFWAAVLVSAAALSGLLIVLLKPLLARYLLAHPNARSSHSVATPQGAGLAVMLALTVVCVAATALGMAPPPPSLVPVLAGAAFLTLLGALDDARAVPVAWRFAGQTLAAVAIVLSLPDGLRLLDPIPLLLERVLFALGIVWFVNAINFLDGLDWMTVAEVVPMTLGVALLHGLAIVPASVGLLALALLGATLGFAWFNKHPASVFLGDAGSLPIGLCLAFMLVYVAEAHLVSAFLLALYPLADATVTLFRRAVRREPVLVAHRTHFYQRAVGGGLRVPQVTLRVFLLGLLLAGLAVTAALARSLTVDVLAFGLGVIAIGLVLRALGRGR